MEHELEETGAILYLCRRSLALSSMLLELFSGPFSSQYLSME